jgi:polysaccharide pyruvyl transferase WcaK-like protein
MRIVLFGYYGNHNLGDDLMLEGLLDELCDEPSLKEIAVVVAKNYYPSRWPRVRFIETTGPAAKLGILYRIARSRAVVMGGGTCIYETPGENNAGLYGLLRILRTSAVLRARTAFCCVGVGEICTDRGRDTIRSIMAMSSQLSFRDEGSYQAAAALVPERGAFSRGGDLVFLNRMVAREQPRAGSGGAMGAIGFSGVHAFKDDPEVVAATARNLQALSSAFGATIVFIPMHRGTFHDHAFHRAVAARLPREVVVAFADFASPQEALERLRSVDFLIGMRLHAIVLADLLSVPNLAVEYSPKVRAYVEKTGFLAELRLAQPRGRFDTETVRTIADAYRKGPERLAGFVRQERTEAYGAVQRLLNELRAW